MSNNACIMNKRLFGRPSSGAGVIVASEYADLSAVNTYNCEQKNYKSRKHVQNSSVHVWREQNQQLQMMADDGRTHDLSIHEVEMLQSYKMLRNNNNKENVNVQMGK
jgi:hypothetical protein